MNYIKSKKVLLKDYPELSEKWLQKMIEEEPEILGLGEDIEVRDTERRQPTGGRLDLLLKNSEDKMFTVELQLGECDPNHIIRTIEYWDVERKRYPQREHCAVIVAENITSRFWNIINLFNQSIPLIAIQLDVRQVGDNFTLNFIKVLDEIEYGVEEEEKEILTDRAYWEKKSTPEMLFIVDNLKKSLNKFFPEIDLNYNKHYIGLKKNNVSHNFVRFRPYKKHVYLSLGKKKISVETINSLEDEGLIFEKESRNYKLRIPTNKAAFEEKMPTIEKLFKVAGGFKENIKEVA